jgi:hypothetical protein
MTNGRNEAPQASTHSQTKLPEVCVGVERLGACSHRVVNHLLVEVADMLRCLLGPTHLGTTWAPESSLGLDVSAMSGFFDGVTPSDMRWLGGHSLESERAVE